MLNTLNRLSKSIQAFVVLLLFTGSSAFSQVPISLPDVTGEPGETKTIAVTVGDLTDEDVFAFGFTVLYDADVIDITGFDKSGAITEPFTVNANPQEGEFIIGGFGSEALEGEGDFIYLEVEYLEYGETDLTWDESRDGFNESGVDPEPDYTNGSATVPMPSLDVYLPDVGHSLGEDIMIPVTAEDLTGEEVYSFQMDMSYNTDVLEITDVVTEGALFEGATVQMNLDEEEGVATVGGFTDVAVEGEGALFYFEASTIALGESPLVFEEFTFNEGTPVANPIDGSILVTDLYVTLQDVTGTVGETVQVAIHTEAPDESLFSYQFTVSYDDELIDIDGFTLDGTLSEDFTVNQNKDNGELIIGGFSSEGFNEEGTLLYLDVMLLEAGETQIEWVDFDYDEGAVIPGLVNGTVTITEPLELSTIADVRGMEDETRVLIEGIVNTNDFGWTVADYFVQDETGGINITDFNEGGNANLPYVSPGVEIRIVGELDTFNNQKNLQVSEYEILSEDNPVPEPVVITGEYMTDDSEYQGMRVTLENMYIVEESIDDWPTDDPVSSGSGVNIQVTSEAEADTFVVRLARNGSPWGEEAHALPEMPFNISGTMGQFHDDTQIFPFFVDDIEPVDVMPEPPQPPHAIGDVINVNGGFEYSDLGNVNDVDVPYWSFNNVSGNSVMEIVDDAAEGDRALAIDFGEFDGTTNDWHVETVNEPFYVQEGDLIRATIWVKADSDERIANMFLGLPGSGDWARYPDEAGATGGGGHMIELNEEWTQYEILHEVSAADEEHSMRIGLALNHEENDGSMIYVDEARVEVAVPAPQPPHAIGDVINYNGSFQHSDLGETEPAGWSLNVADGSFAEVVDDAQDGDNRALQFDVSYDTAGDWHLNEATSEPVNVVEGDKYEVSAWLKADHDQHVVTRVYLGMPGSGGWERARGWDTPEINIGQDWQEISFTHTATAQNEEHGMRVGIELNYEGNDGAIAFIDNVTVTKVEPTSSEVANAVPQEFRLNQNYPNPFNPTTTISYELPEAAHVTIDVYNVVGQHVMSLVNTEQNQGVHQVNFDATNLSSGMYIYRMQAGSFVQTQKMMLVK